MVMIVMMRVGVMIVSVMMAVMFAAVRRVRQAALQVRRDHLFDGRAGLSRAHGDAVMSKVGQCPMANAAGNDDRHPLLAQPARRRWFMFGCGLDFVQYHPRFRIRFNQRKLTGTAECPSTGRFHEGWQCAWDVFVLQWSFVECLFC